MFTLPKRKNESYKKDYGTVLIIAGNENYGGAAILAARAALYCGAGLVTLASHKKNHSPLHSIQPEIMLVDWQENLKDYIKAADVLLIGPGLGTDTFALKIFKDALKHLREDQVLALDASALHLYKKVQIPDCQLILTPHLGEMRALSGLSNDEINDETCLEFSEEEKCYLVLKGHVSKLYYDGKIHKNIPGTPAMATGGSGDVLAGIIAGLAGQLDTLQAVKLGLYLHSKIALDLAQNNYLVLPSQIIEGLPREMKKLESREIRV